MTGGADNRIPHLIQGYKDFTDVIEEHGAEILYTDEFPVQGQMFTRDHFAVIGNKILLCPHNKPEQDVMHWMAALSSLGKIAGKSLIDPPLDAIIHGGDVILHNDTLYLGQGGSGTDKAGLEFMKRKFGEHFNVKPINMGRFHQLNGRPAVHLDTLFNPLSKDKALIYPDGIDDKDIYKLEKKFELLPVDAQEQDSLGTNVLSLGDGVVVSQKIHGRINSTLRDKSFTVKEIDMPAMQTVGGGFRCATVPLERE